ncbi:MAG: hypothetical protein ACLSHC_14645 [Bilophila wadsworthia]
MMLEEVTLHPSCPHTRGQVSGPRAPPDTGDSSQYPCSKLRKLGVNPKAYFKAGD